MKAAQQISYEPWPEHPRAGDSFTVVAKASSGLHVRTSVLAGPAVVADNRVSFIRPGEVRLKLTQEGNEQFEPAPDVVLTFNVSKAQQTIAIDPLPAEIFCGDRIVIKASASSQLPVSFRVLNGPAQLTGWQVAIINGPGQVEIEASQVGNDKILPAKVTLSFTSLKRRQEIRFTELHGGESEGPGFAFKATSTSGLPVNLSVISGQARICNNELVLTGFGPVEIKAIQPGDSFYALTEVVQSFVPPRRRQTIAFTAVRSAVRVGEVLTLQATSNSGLPVAFGIVEGKANVEGNQITPGAVGALTIKVTQPGNENYEPTEALQHLSVLKARQTLMFKPLPKEVFFGDRCNLEVTTSSGLAPISLSLVSGTASLSGHRLTLNGAGPVVIKATQAGNELYEAAEAEQTIEVLKARQTITLERLPPEATVGESLPVKATADSGLTVGLEVLSGPAEIADGRLAVRGAGEVKIKASQSGDENYAPAPEVVHALTAVKVSQTVRFDLEGEQLQIGDPLVLNAEASSGLPVMFRLLSGPAELNGNTLVGTGDGRLEVEVEQPGDGKYLPSKMRRSLLVIKRPQEVRFEQPADRKFGDAAFAVRASATSGLPVAFSVVSGPARIKANDVNLMGAGRVELKAIQPGDRTFAPAEASCSFAVGKGGQTIRFDTVPEVVNVGDVCTLQARASSGLPVELSILEGPASLQGNRLTAEGAGIVKIKATQNGNQDYEPTETEQSLAVVKVRQTLNFKALPREIFVGDHFTLEAVANSGLADVRFRVAAGKATVCGQELALTGPGSVVIKAEQSGSQKFEPVEAEQSIAVLKAKQTIRLDQMPSEAVVGESFPIQATVASGLPVAIEVISGSAKIAEGRLTLAGAGEVKIRASQPGDENHAPAAELVHTLMVVKAQQTIRFDLSCEELQIGEPLVLKAEASSGQPSTFRLVSGPAELNGDTLVGTSAGRVEVEAQEPGDVKYLPARVRRSLVITRKTQEIRFERLPDMKVGQPPFTVRAMVSSGLSATFSVVSGPAQIRNNEVTIRGAGRVEIKAVQAGDRTYAPAEAVSFFSVGKGSQTIRFGEVPGSVIVGEAYSLQASASSGLAVSFRIAEGRASLEGNRLTAEAAGIVLIKAMQQGDQNYEPTETEQRVTFVRARQTLEFKPLPGELFFGGRCSLAAVASSGLSDVSFSVVSGKATISDNQLLVNGTGPVVIKAVQAGNEKFDAAEVEQSVTVFKAKQIIHFDALPREATAGKSIPVRATVASGLPVNIEVLAGPAEIVDGQLTLGGAGEVKIRATQSGDENHAPAAEVVAALTSVKAAQTVQFDLASQELQIGETIVLTSTASSGLPVTFRLASGPGELKGNSLVATGAGRVEVEAEQTGDATYLPAKVRRSLLIGKKPQEIRFDPIRDRKMGEPPFSVRATASSRLPVTLSIASGPAKISNGELTLTGTGRVAIKATQPGDSTYAEAEAICSFLVGKGRQKIDFDEMSGSVAVGDTCSLRARASSGLPVNFSVVEGKANLTGNRFTAEAAGTVTIKATQPGSGDYEPAEARQSLTVIKARHTLDFKELPRGLAVGDRCTLEAVASSGLTGVSFTVISGKATISARELVLTGAGSAVIRASHPGNEKFEAVETDQSIAVLKAKQTIRLHQMPGEALVGESFPVQATAVSGLPVTIEVISGPAEIIDGRLNLRRAGEVKIKATQSGDDNYSPAPEIVHILTAKKSEQTVQFDLRCEELQIGASIVLTADASSGLPVKFKLLSGTAQLKGNALVGTRAGRVEIEAGQPGDDKYLPAKIQRSLLIVKKQQEILFAEAHEGGNEEPCFEFKATSSSGLPVSLSVVSGQAQIRDNAITLTGVGPVTLKATQSGDDFYSATELVRSFTTPRRRQAIRFENQPATIRLGETCTVQVSASSGLPVSLSVLAGRGRLSGNQLTPDTAGLLTVKATQSGNDDYEPAEARLDISVLKAGQTIEFKPLHGEVFVGDRCNLEAVASSGLTAFRFSVVSGKATVSGSQLTLNSAGSLVIKAVQPGNEKFEAAEAELSVGVLKAKQTIRFVGVPSQATVGESFPVRATVGSGLSVKIELLSGPAEIVDGQLTLRGAGEVKIKASQSGDENFAPSAEIVHTLTAVKAAQTVGFELSGEQLQIGESMMLRATASSGLPVIFRVLSGPAELKGNSLFGTSAGRVEIEVEQAGNDSYLQAKAQRSLIVAKRSQQIRFEPLPDRKVGEPAFRLNATATSGLPVTFNVASGPAQISNNEVSLRGAGRVQIKATQAGDNTYAPTEAVCSFSIGKSRQTISFADEPAAISVGDTCTLQASASSGLPLTFSVFEGRASVAGNRLTAEAAGVIKIQATQAGNEDYESAQAHRNLRVNKARQTLAFKPLPKQVFVGDLCALEATASSALTALSFSVVSGKAGISGNQLTFNGAGSVVIKAAQAGNEKFEAAEAQQTIAVLKAKQAINLDPLPGEVSAGETIPLRATVASGLPVSIQVLSGPAEIVDGKLALRGAGEVKIKASQPGNENYAPAPEIIRTLKPGRGRQTIRFDFSKKELPIGDSILLTATASSGQPITFRLVSGPAEVYGDSLVGTGAGRVEVEAEQAGDSTFLPAKIKRSLEVVKRSQSILFEQLQDRKVGEPPFNISAKATSGLPVTFSVVSGPASISGSEVSLSGRGKVRIVASQPGDDKFESAPPIEAEFDAKNPVRMRQAVVLACVVLAALLIVGALMFWPSKHPTQNPNLSQVRQKTQESTINPASNAQKDRDVAFGQSMSNAVALLREGQADAARPLIEKMLQERPGDPAALALKAQIDSSIEEAAKLKEFQQTMQSAQQAESDQKWPQAVEFLKQALLRASSLKDTNYAQPLASELSYANNMVAAQAALSQTNYAEAINRAEGALAVKANDPSATKIKADAQNGKQYQDTLKTAQTELARGNYAAAIGQADAALRLRPNEAEATKVKLLAQQEQTYQTAVTAFKQGDYATALRQSQQYQGTQRFDQLGAQIGQEQKQLKTMQKAINDGNYADILGSSLPAKPAFDRIKATATEENEALKQARQKLAAGDLSYMAAIEQQSYGSKSPFVAIVNEGRKVQEALKNQQKSNAVPAAASVAATATVPATIVATTPTNASPNSTTTAAPTPVPATSPTTAFSTNPSPAIASSTNPANTLAIGRNDRLLEYWEIYFGLKPRPSGSDVKPVHDPTKDSAYNLEQFDKVEAEYVNSGALNTERKHRLNALRWVVSGGRKGEAPGFTK